MGNLIGLGYLGIGLLVVREVYLRIYRHDTTGRYAREWDGDDRVMTTFMSLLAGLVWPATLVVLGASSLLKNLEEREGAER